MFSGGGYAYYDNYEHLKLLQCQNASRFLFPTCTCSTDFFVHFMNHTNAEVQNVTLLDCLKIPINFTTIDNKQRTRIDQNIFESKVRRLKRHDNETATRLTRSTTLTLEDSPYEVTSRVLIPSGVKMFLEPGVRMYFDRGAGLRVQGKIKL